MTRRKSVQSKIEARIAGVSGVNAPIDFNRVKESGYPTTPRHSHAENTNMTMPAQLSRQAPFPEKPMLIDMRSELQVPALAALDALAVGTPPQPRDLSAAILVVESEAERLGDHGLEALGEQLRVIAILDTPRANESIRPILGQFVAHLRGAQTAQ